jgi:hypothetical protein
MELDRKIREYPLPFEGAGNSPSSDGKPDDEAKVKWRFIIAHAQDACQYLLGSDRTELSFLA